MGNNINFLLTNVCSCEQVEVFETENVSTRGELEPPTFRFMPVLQHNVAEMYAKLMSDLKMLNTHLVSLWLEILQYVAPFTNII